MLSGDWCLPVALSTHRPPSAWCCAQASIDQFGFSIGIKPDASMRISASLGNVRALDCTLPEGHPYHQACGLRAGSNKSMVR